MDLAAKLARACPGVEQSDAPVDRLAYGRDLWPRHHLEVRAGRVVEQSRPGLIAWPTSTAQAAEVVRFCRAEGVALVPFGAGSGVCGAVLPDAGTVVLDLKRMSSVRRLDPGAPRLDVEAGAMGISLEERVQREGWTIGHFPSSILCSTVGGWLAARGAGQCSGRYGKIEDMVAAIELIDGEGEVHHLSRRTGGGVDLTPLIIGSEGTLGVITACSLRLHPRPATHAYASFRFAGLEEGWEALRAMFQAGLRPAVARLYDPFDSLLARQGSVKREHRVPPGEEHPAPGAGHTVLGRMLRHPAWINHAIEGLGGPALGGSTLVLIFEGQGDEPHDDAARATRLAALTGGQPTGEGPARRWLQHRYSISYRQSVVFRSGAFSDTFEVAAPWSRLKALYEGVHRALEKRVFVMAHLSHAYPDGCSIYFSFVGAAASDDEALRLYEAAWQDALRAALEAGGTLSHHHGIGRSKAPRLGAELGAGIDVVRGLMRAFDPGGLMNPG
ncbi:MAG: FAD-binding oxidoreductase, partial [Myxococcales bacterium]